MRDRTCRRYLQNGAGTPTLGNVAGYASNLLYAASETPGECGHRCRIGHKRYLRFRSVASRARLSARHPAASLQRSSQQRGVHELRKDRANRIDTQLDQWRCQGNLAAGDAHEVSFNFARRPLHLNDPTYQTPNWNAGARHNECAVQQRHRDRRGRWRCGCRTPGGSHQCSS